MVEAHGGPVVIDCVALDEAYLPAGAEADTQIQRTTVPAGSYFLLGDNRRAAADSRIEGPVAEADVAGTVVLVGVPSPTTQRVVVGLLGLVFTVVLGLAFRSTRPRATSPRPDPWASTD